MVIFELKDFAHVSMLKSTTEDIFVIMGKKIQFPGVILIEDMLIYLERLENAIAEDAEHPQDKTDTDENGREFIKSRITLRQKTYPLKQLMQNAIEKNESIVFSYSN
jgi:Domain of unknown function (DUF1840)